MGPKFQREVGWTVAFLGCSDWAIVLLDSYARYDLAVSMIRLMHLPLLHFLLSPICAPALIFIGMLLYVRARETELTQPIEIATLYGENEKPLPRPVVKRRWKNLLWTVPAAAITGAVILVMSLYFVSPEAPPVPTPPAVDALAFVAYPLWTAPTISSKSVSAVNQTQIGPSFFNNQGTIQGGVKVIDSSISGTPDPQHHMQLFANPKGGNLGHLEMDHVDVEYRTEWESFLEDLERFSGDVEQINGIAERLNSVTASDLAKLPEGTGKTFCEHQIAGIISAAKANSANEAPLVLALREHRPKCLNP